MTTSHRIALGAASLATILGLTACGGATQAPVAAPDATATTSGLPASAATGRSKTACNALLDMVKKNRAGTSTPADALALMGQLSVAADMASEPVKSAAAALNAAPDFPQAGVDRMKDACASVGVKFPR